MAYGKPVKTRPQRPAMKMKTRTPSTPVSKRTPGGEAEAEHRDGTGRHGARSATISPSSSDDAADGRHQQSVEVAVLDVGDERAGPREMPVTAKMIATGSWKAGSRSPPALLATFCRAPMFTTVEEHGDEQGREDRLGLPRDAPQRPPGHADRVGDEPGLAGPHRGRTGERMGGHGGHRSSSCALVLGQAHPVAGELEEDVVEGGRAQGELLHLHARLAERHRDRADQRRPVGGRHGELVAVELDGGHAVEIDHRSPRGVRNAVDPSDDDVIADRPLQVARGCPRR